MKKNRIPFRLTEYNKGGYTIETKGSEIDKPRKVRIICTDKKGDNGTLVALIDFGDTEGVYTYTTAGHWTCGIGSALDLMLIKCGFENGDTLCYESDINKFIYICTGRAARNFHALLDNHKILFTDDSFSYDTEYTIRLATKEEREQLFLAIDKAGKYWDSENKCIKSKQTCSFKPFDKVIGKYNGTWQIDLFDHFDNVNFPNSAYRCMGYNYNQCIKYTDDTEHLVGTSEKAPLEHTELI